MSRKVRYTRLTFAALASAALLAAGLPAPVYAQDQSQPAAGTQQAQTYTNEQLDALLAPIALYPDQLLTQVLMATTFPVEVVSAYRWSQEPANKSLTGDALTKALEAENWDPSVKSLVPFPQVLSMLNDKLDWMEQVGYAMSTQQADVLNSVQRLRKQAQNSGHLQSSQQQTVSTQGQTIVIEPAQPNVVYVPSYNPTVVYGAWPYPAYPPVYMPPPPGYVAGSALVAGLAFGTGVAITAGLWGWAQPNWHGGNVNVNVNHFNNINGRRPPLYNSNWHAAARPGGGFHAPAGPVGRPARANGIGHRSVSVPGNIVRPPAGLGPNGNHPAIGPNGRPGQGGMRPGQNGGGIQHRPNANGGNPGFNPGNRPAANGGNHSFNPGNRPAGGHFPGSGAGQRPAFNGGGGNAFSGMNRGHAAGQFGQRGAQSMHFNRTGGGGFRGRR